MESICATFNSLVNAQHDWKVVENTFVTILSHFGLNLSDLASFISHSLISEKNLKHQKLWAFKTCSCKEVTGKHFVAKQTSEFDDIYTINFQSSRPEIRANSNFDCRVLTHLCVSILRARESVWTNISASTSMKLHTLACRLKQYFIHEITLSLSSSSDSDSEVEAEKENSHFKKSIKRMRKKYAHQPAPKKAKTVAPRQRNFLTLCKTAMQSYHQERKKLDELLGTLPFKVDTNYIEADFQELSNKLNELFKKKSEQDTLCILNDTPECMVGEIEALYRSFQTLKGTVFTNLSKCKENALKQLKRHQEEEQREAKRAEKEKLAAEKDEAEKAADKVEEELIKIAADAERDNHPKNLPLEEGEITEMERMQSYYAKMTELAASLALELEEYVPRFERLQDYSTTHLRYMRAQCDMAARSITEILNCRQSRDPHISWNGPNFLTASPTDLPDFYAALRRKRERQCKLRQW